MPKKTINWQNGHSRQEIIGKSPGLPHPNPPKIKKEPQLNGLKSYQDPICRFMEQID